MFTDIFVPLGFWSNWLPLLFIIFISSAMSALITISFMLWREHYKQLEKNKLIVTLE